MRRHEWHLQDPQHAKLMNYLEGYPVLRELYDAKQRLIRFMLLRTVTRQRAQKQLPRLLRLLKQLDLSPLRTLAKTLRS